MSGVVVDLKTKIVSRGMWKDTEIERVELRAPVVRDLLGLDFITPTESTKSMIALISRLSGLTETVVGGLSLADFSEISARVTGLMSKPGPRK